MEVEEEVPVKRERKFMPGDRVVAKAGTTWDENVEDDKDFLLLAGHYGHVVETCSDNCGNSLVIHVWFEGTIDGRKRTGWIIRHVWHMYPEELEHAD